MAYDPVREEIHDYFGGRADLNAHVLRATSAAFSEDPLRVLRGMQFACRFDLTVDAATAAMCRSIADQYPTLPKERVCDEFMKWAIQSSRPGRILEYLRATGWLAISRYSDGSSRCRRIRSGIPKAMWGRTRCTLSTRPPGSPNASA